MFLSKGQHVCNGSVASCVRVKTPGTVRMSGCACLIQKRPAHVHTCEVHSTAHPLCLGTYERHKREGGLQRELLVSSAQLCRCRRVVTARAPFLLGADAAVTERETSPVRQSVLALRPQGSGQLVFLFFPLCFRLLSFIKITLLFKDL